MKLMMQFEYTEQVIPPRHRKPRPEVRKGKIQLTFREVTGKEAPVAIIEHSHARDSDDNRYATEKLYRWYKNKLYAKAVLRRYSRGPKLGQTAEEFATDPYPYVFEATSDSWYSKSQNLHARRTEFRAFAASILFIDGERWEVANEPRYVIMTFGLGHNHGIGWGTSLSVDQSYNPNIGHNRYFRIDQFELAIAEATRVALARGDTKALPILTRQDVDRFEVLIPAAVRLHPAREHGRGDQFLNEVERLIEKAPDASVAGFALMAILAKKL